MFSCVVWTVMDRLDLMRAFVTVAQTGSFTAAGRRLGKSKTLISKYVGALEDQLGARLLQRTTRQVGLTNVGKAYMERAEELLAEFDMLEEAVRAEQGAPSGRLRITAPQTFGELQLVDLAADFLAEFPEIRLDITLDDRFVDLVAESLDVGIRIGTLDDSSLIARRLCPVRIIVCAAPGYIARHGRPVHPADLIAHKCVVDTNFRSGPSWRFLIDGEVENVAVPARLGVNSASAACQALVRGQGIGLCPDFVVADELADGRLIELLEEFEGGYEHSLFLVYPHRLHLAQRVRTFIDFAANWVAARPQWRSPVLDNMKRKAG